MGKEQELKKYPIFHSSAQHREVLFNYLCRLELNGQKLPRNNLEIATVLQDELGADFVRSKKIIKAAIYDLRHVIGINTDHLLEVEPEKLSERIKKPVQMGMAPKEIVAFLGINGYAAETERVHIALKDGRKTGLYPRPSVEDQKHALTTVKQPETDVEIAERVRNWDKVWTFFNERGINTTNLSRADYFAMFDKYEAVRIGAFGINPPRRELLNSIIQYIQSLKLTPNQFSGAVQNFRINHPLWEPVIRIKPTKKASDKPIVEPQPKKEPTPRVYPKKIRKWKHPPRSSRIPSKVVDTTNEVTDVIEQIVPPQLPEQVSVLAEVVPIMEPDTTFLALVESPLAVPEEYISDDQSRSLLDQIETPTAVAEASATPPAIENRGSQRFPLKEPHIRILAGMLGHKQNRRLIRQALARNGIKIEDQEFESILNKYRLMNKTNYENMDTLTIALRQISRIIIPLIAYGQGAVLLQAQTDQNARYLLGILGNVLESEIEDLYNEIRFNFIATHQP